MKERFISALRENVNREGVEKLIAYLEESDFFTAPASTKFHLACEGGLCEHSVNVFNRLVNMAKAENAPYSMETLAICGLLHDVCKQNKKLVIVVTHNQALKDMADKVITIKNGRIERVYNNEQPKPIEEIEW